MAYLWHTSYLVGKKTRMIGRLPYPGETPEP